MTWDDRTLTKEPPRRDGLHPAIRMAAVAALLAVPLALLRAPAGGPGGPLRLLGVGASQLDRALPEFAALRPPVESPGGYDGQFYAQLALDPALCRGAELRRALDTPEYRARRIGLPALAWLAGGGRPRAVVTVYALTNLLFAGLLVGLVARRTRLARPRDLLLATALLWTTGSLTSVDRSLSDFPASVLLLAAAWMAGRPAGAAGAIAAAALMRETSLLGLAVAWPASFRRRDLVRSAAAAAAVGVPLVLWLGWCRFRLGGAGASPTDAFGLPLLAWVERLAGAARDLVHDAPSAPWNQRGRLLFELLAPLSLAVQAVFFAVRRDARDPVWRLGAVWAGLLLFLGPQVWGEQYASTRVLLPLTFAFNVRLHTAAGTARAFAWFAAGNAGLVWMAISALA
jgi:hypothetical protein